jgi:RND family efflux transporter MFP subunit
MLKRLVIPAGLIVCACAAFFANRLQTPLKAGVNKEENPVPIAAVAKVNRETLTQTLTVAAEFRPYQHVALHAKVSGFLQSISVDSGDHVAEGQVLAHLEAPELKSEERKAEAAHMASQQEVIRAEAAFKDLDSASNRLLEVSKQRQNFIAQQEMDNALAKSAAAQAALAVAKQKVKESAADFEKAKAMVAYTTVTAPFPGIVTKRFYDPGALIPSSASAGSKTPLLEMAEVNRLRLEFPVPESAVPFIRVGAKATITVSAVGAVFEGQVSRFSGLIERATRTMLTEIEVDNAKGHITPGMYASVTLVLKESKEARAIPSQALFGGENQRVLFVGPTGVLEERSVTLGLQTPTRVEVLSGLEPGDLVVVGSRSGLLPGLKVTPQERSPSQRE